MHPIILAAMAGGARPAVILVDLNGTSSAHTRINATGSDCYAGCTIQSDGVEWAVSNTGVHAGTNLGAWMLHGSNSDYWIKLRNFSGDPLAAGSADKFVWLPMTSTRVWKIVDVSIGGGAETCQFDLQIATDSGGTNIIDDKTYNLSATKETDQ